MRTIAALLTVSLLLCMAGCGGCEPAPLAEGPAQPVPKAKPRPVEDDSQKADRETAAPGPELVSPPDRAMLDPVDSPFEWSEVPGADVYELRVTAQGYEEPILNVQVGGTQHRFRRVGPQQTDIAHEWTWTVRARVDGKWSDWSQARSFMWAAGVTDQSALKSAGSNGDLIKLQGKWKVVERIEEGESDSVLPDAVFVFRADTLLMGRLGAEPMGCHIRLDSSTTPPQMDMVVRLSPSEPPIICPGIYSLEGDELRFCSTGAGLPRPVRFESKKGSGHTLFVLRRLPKREGKEPNAGTSSSGESN